ncbi:hypothetical protein [Rubritalea tangerina]|uniref:hypothetical protein n=1 Tax=Rubritalea tangerina TaxID=430798 RepID=UPI00360A7FA8
MVCHLSSFIITRSVFKEDKAIPLRYGAPIVFCDIVGSTPAICGCVAIQIRKYSLHPIAR